MKLSSSGGHLWAAVQTRARIDVRQLRSGRWRRLGPSLPINRLITALGEGSGAHRTVDVALADVESGERTLWSLSRGHWERQTPLKGIGGGPMPGGPVRLGSRIYLPIIDALTEPWRLSVHVFRNGAWAAAGGPVNRGKGNAQGTLSVAEGAVWISWQENEARPDGLFRTRMYVQPVAPGEGRARRVWAGTSIGPGAIEIVQAIGRRWILYMPAARGRRALTVAVKPLG